MIWEGGGGGRRPLLPVAVAVYGQLLENCWVLWGGCAERKLQVGQASGTEYLGSWRASPGWVCLLLCLEGELKALEAEEI